MPPQAAGEGVPDLINQPSSVAYATASPFYKGEAYKCGCTSLTSVIIPDSVTEIGNSAFYGCTSLSSIIIPDSVTYIAVDAFTNCSSLTIYCEAEEKPSGWNTDWNSSNRPVVWGYKGEN